MGVVISIRAKMFSKGSMHVPQMRGIKIPKCAQTPEVVGDPLVKFLGSGGKFFRMQIASASNITSGGLRAKTFKPFETSILLPLSS
jgi:hypothetical protein